MSICREVRVPKLGFWFSEVIFERLKSLLRPGKFLRYWSDVLTILVTYPG